MQIETNYNPDVLTCLANLSNDEVFTPPNLVNQILDLLPNSLWSDKNATFLDPACKSGVFLREIAKRLIEGLQNEIPDLQKRLNHIYTKQLFGIAITELTALLSRRSLYCSKMANGKYSVCTAFNNGQGNIFFERTEHTWQRGRCVFCGANESEYDRGEELETHAYKFIHTANPEEIFNMKFDVVIGNPPYQMSDGGFGISATPIYQKFVAQAKKLKPRFLSMIIPARWYSAGKGLDEFRREMLNDKSIRKIVDFPEASDCFPGVQIKGGVCYFVWERDNPGLCEVITQRKDAIVSRMNRNLLEDNCETFIRYNEAIQILSKVKEYKEPTLNMQVSARKPFGLDTTFQAEDKKRANAIKIFQNGGIGFSPRTIVKKNANLIDRFKVLIPRAGSGSDSFPHTILGLPFVAEPGSACTETYIVLGHYDTEQECKNLCTYVKSRFFRFLVLLIKPTQDASARVYSFVPALDMRQRWTDLELFKRYKVTAEEQEFISTLVRDMENINE